MALNSITAGSRVLITGFTGSLGTRLIEILSDQAVEIIGLSRDEKKQLDIRRCFPHVECILGDVRDAAAVREAVRGVDVVIHAASLKQVDISELQPREYVLTNVMGTVNVIDAVFAEGTVRRCIGVSSDKAAGRIANCYGLTKRILEKLFLAAARHAASYAPLCKTAFNVARYGNVLGTRGSVLPHWQELRRRKEPLQVTDPTMTRFFFTLDEAVALLDFALTCAPGVIVSKRMAAATLMDMADVMQTAGIEVIGRRPGEKLHEELLSAEEMSQTVQVGEDYFLHSTSFPPQQAAMAYTSDVAHRLSVLELREMLEEYMQ